MGGPNGQQQQQRSLRSPSTKLSSSTVPSSPLSLSPSSLLPSTATDVDCSNPNETIDSVIKAFADFKPRKENKNKYFDEIIINNESRHSDIDGTKHKRIDRVTDSICAIVPFYNEKASEIHATL